MRLVGCLDGHVTERRMRLSCQCGQDRWWAACCGSFLMSTAVGRWHFGRPNDSCSSQSPSVPVSLYLKEE